MKFKNVLVFMSVLCSATTQNLGGATNNTVTIAGPTSFATDGTRPLNLTCQSGTSGNVGYSWTDKDNNPLECGKLTHDSVCTLRPKPEDDGHNVVCEVFTFSDRVYRNASYKLNLQYPPPQAPSIREESSWTKPLKQGECITCTVSGGKPNVAKITFECQNPYHIGQQNDNRTVSTITVDTSQATADNMTCTCSAHWDPEPSLYPNTTDMEFVLEYKANVTHFTVNGNTITTLSESSKVTFWCQGAGRPTPRLILDKRGNDQTIASSTAPERGLLHTIQSARCEDFGTYTCDANNNFPNPHSETAQLFVKCAPRVPDESFDRSNLCNLTQVGLNVSVVGYPTPNISVYSLRNKTVPDNAFNTNCVRDDTLQHLVHCEVTPGNVSASGCDVYDILIWNEHGNISLSAVDQHKPQPEDKEQLSVGEIVGIAVGILGVFIVIGTVCVAVRKRNKRKQKTYEHYENTNMENTNTASVQRVATIQPHLRGSQTPNTNDQPHSGQTPPYDAYGLEPGYANPADMIQRPSTSCAKAETNPTPLDPGYATADDIGMSTDAQRVAVSYNPRNNSLTSRSADKSFDVTLQPAEPANKPQDDGVDEYNVLGGQEATSGPDPTYSHINKVNKNQ